MDNKYIFILCPPLQGSTVLYRLISTSKKVTTFLPLANRPNMWMGEGAGLFEPIYPEYVPQRWDPNYPLNMSKVGELYHKYWDSSKPIKCDKTPPTICRAKMFEDYFSQLGEVYFITQIRNPFYVGYSAETWDKYAEFQKWNIENLKNVIHVTYEDLCSNTDETVSRILEKYPFLESFNLDDVIQPWGGERGGKIKNSNTQLRDVESKINYFTNNNYLLKYFDYNII